jgi:hypothetical protein
MTDHPNSHGTIPVPPTAAEITDFLDQGWKALGIVLPSQELTPTERAVQRAVSILTSAER